MMNRAQLRLLIRCSRAGGAEDANPTFVAYAELCYAAAAAMLSFNTVFLSLENLSVLTDDFHSECSPHFHAIFLCCYFTLFTAIHC